jgi:site-specific recombinase XerD
MGVPPEEDSVLSEYLRLLRLQKGLGERTVECYRRDLTQFAEFLAGCGK